MFDFDKIFSDSPAASTVLELAERHLEQSFRYDRKRVEEIGPDRACAEWLLRCGGAVRFKNVGSLTSNYNAIPTGPVGHFQVEEIRAVNACITSDGFAHLNGLNALKKIHLEKCDLITDSTLARCNLAKATLESIVLVDLNRLSDNGLTYLAGLKNLKQIQLARLPGINNREAVLRLLKNELPSCHVAFDDQWPSAPELKEK